MKKTLLYFVFAILFMFSAGFAFGQCTPNPAIIDPDGTGRMDPDTIEATVGVATNVVATIICPDTATLGTQGHLEIHHITLRSLQNKPAWLNNVCNPSNCEFPSQEAKCVLITGTPLPADTGYTSITVLVDVWNTIMGTPVCATCTTYPNGYDAGMPLVVWVHPAGYNVAEIEHKGFGILPAQPNPFTTTVKLGCYTETPQTVTLRVFDMVGKEVYNEIANTNAGENYFSFNGSDLNDGLYFYSLTDGQNRVITKKFVKSR
ncbi:MAG TPA: T9SS type A sorting domain-containing protein [Bacteroidales bacterium]|nr:T9SS type A sorting domain-containing protein [Bacteroidales bacterium]